MTELGEQRSALESLESILTDTRHPTCPHHPSLSTQSGYSFLVQNDFRKQPTPMPLLDNLPEKDQANSKTRKSCWYLQLVKKALKDRKIGETRIAAKSLKHLIDQYPQSVEAHRAYIETKAMLKDTPDVQRWYADLVKTQPQNAVYRYGQGLAYSYSEPPDLPFVLEITHGSGSTGSLNFLYPSNAGVGL